MADPPLDPERAVWTRADSALEDWYEAKHWVQSEKQSTWRGERPYRCSLPRTMPMLFMRGNWYVQTV